jgi:hypothetical protein
VSSWNGSTWLTQQYKLTTPGGLSLLDLNLNWDSARSRFVLAAVDTTIRTPNVWYGYSNADGTAWTVSKIVLPGSFSSAGWDYPSIGVDASGRIVIGAVSYTTTSANGYYATVSTDGSTFSSPALVTAGTGTGGGAYSRVVATNNVFYAFVPTLNGNNLPTAINRWQSSDGNAWTGPNSVATFAAPSNNTPQGYPTPIFYAPLLTAQGFTNGQWSVAFQVNNGGYNQVNNGGYNNVEICTSSRGCGVVNPAATDEFLAGTSVSSDNGYWVSYYTYTSAPRTLPLITRAIYFPPGQAGIGATTNTGINPTCWYSTTNRCPALGSCYAAGDFQAVASNPYGGASTPFIKQSSNGNDLFQSFVQDPQGSSTGTFVPNTMWVPLGTDISYLGDGASPPQPAFPPIVTKGVPGGW